MKRFNFFGKEIYICSKEEKDRIAQALIWGGIYTDQVARELSTDIHNGKFKDGETVRKIHNEIIQRKAESDFCLRRL